MNTNENLAPTVELAEGKFGAEVLQSKQPVLVAFWAPWSGACQILDPILQAVARTLEGKVKVFRINADDSLDLSIWYDIQSVPTLVCFDQGRPCLRIVGTATKEAILARLKSSGVTRATATTTRGTSGALRQSRKGEYAR